MENFNQFSNIEGFILGFNRQVFGHRSWKLENFNRRKIILKWIYNFEVISDDYDSSYDYDCFSKPVFVLRINSQNIYFSFIFRLIYRIFIFCDASNQLEFDKLDIHSSYWAILSNIRNEKNADMAELLDQNPSHIRPYKLCTSYLKYKYIRL